MTELLTLPGDIGHATALLAMAASLATATVGALFGVGGGTVLLALLAVLLPAAALIPVHAAVQIGATAGRTALLHRQILRTTLVPFALGSAAGSVLTGLLYLRLPPWLIQYAVAAFIVWSVAGSLPRFDGRRLFAAGAVSGALTMLFGATGPFVAALVRSMRLAPLPYVATQAAMMTLQHAIKIAVFAGLGFAFAPYALLIALMLASGFAGTLLGRALLRRVSEMRYRPVLNAVLLLLAARLVWMASAALLDG